MIPARQALKPAGISSTISGEHVRQSLTIEDISKDNMIGRSQLQKLFREEYQCGVY